MCDFLNPAPQDFFGIENSQPDKLYAPIETLKKLDDESLNSIANVAGKCSERRRKEPPPLIYAAAR
jgi:hypothetical protein